MSGIFSYIHHKNQPNVGKYTIHYGFMDGMGNKAAFFHNSYCVFVAPIYSWTSFFHILSRPPSDRFVTPTPWTPSTRKLSSFFKAVLERWGSNHSMHCSGSGDRW